MDRDQFISMMMPYAMQASQQTGLDPRLVIAQSALETGWGRSAPGMNYFGIKSHGRSGGQSLPTTEVYNGQPVGIIDSFRTYSDPSESVSDYVNFLQTNPRYQPLLEAEGLDAQLAALGASGYATDPQYESKLRSIARGIEVGPMRDDDLIANAGAAINRAEAPRPSGLGRMSELFSTSSAPAASGGGNVAYGGGGLIPGLMLLSGKAGEGLSRDQRRMLGFAALADAGAALSGREGGQTRAIMSQMQSDQERERLRRQGLLQNLVAFEQALLPYRISGMEPPAGIMSAYNSALADFSAAGGAVPVGGGAPSAAPATTAGVTPPAPVTEMPLDEPVAADPIADLERRRDMALAAGQTAMAQNFQAQIDARKEGEAAAQQAETEASDIDYRINVIDQVLNSPDLEGVVGRIAGRVDPKGLGGGVLFSEDEEVVIALLDQIGGQNFLQAFESLKGGGTITEIEGLKAEAAISRIGNRRMSEEGYRRALEELKQIYANARARKLGQEVPFPDVGAAQESDERTVDDLLNQYGG